MWRSVLVFRGVLLAVFLVYAAALSAVWLPLGVLPLAGWAAVTAISVWVLLSLRGSTGPIWMADGRRLSKPALLAQHVADAAEQWLLLPLYALFVVVALVIEREHVALYGLLVLFTVFLVRALGPLRWRALCVSFAHVAVMERRYTDALVWSDRLAGRQAAHPGDLQGIGRLRSAALLGLGRIDEGRDLAESVWTGEIDGRASWLATLRLGQGDPRLAVAVLKAHTPLGPVDELELLILRALVVAKGHPVAFDAPELERRLDTIPSTWADRSLLALATWAQSTGDSALSRSYLQRLSTPIASSDVFHGAVPWAAAMLDDALAGRASQRPTTVELAPALSRERPAAPDSRTNAFAAPSAEASTVGPARSQPSAGVLPLEWVTVGVRATRMRWVRFAALLTLWPLTASAIVLLAVAWLSGWTDSESKTAGIVAGVLIVAFLHGVATSLVGAGLVAERLPGSGPVMVLTDGRRLTSTGFRALVVLGVANSTMVSAVFILLAAAAVLAGVQPSWGAVVFVLVVALLAVIPVGAQWRRRRTNRMLYAAIFGTTAQFVAAGSLPALGGLRGAQLAGLRALSGLWAGDANDARAELEGSLAWVPQGATLLACFRASEGALDLPQALRQPVPSELGPAWRQGLALALAGLHSGQCAQLNGRVAAWERLSEELPNRFGALLALAAGGVRLACGHEPPPYFYSLEPNDLVGVVQSWPVLADAHAALATARQDLGFSAGRRR